MGWNETKNSLKRVANLGGILPLVRKFWYGAKWLTDSRFRFEEGAERRQFLAFTQKTHQLFPRSAASDKKLPPLLVVNLGRRGIVVELALAKACEVSGFRPVVLANYDRWTWRYYHHVGIDIYAWEDFHCPAPPELVNSLLASVHTFEQLLGLTYAGARVGKYAASTALRQLRVGRFDLAEPATRQAMRSFLRRAIEAVGAARLVLDKLRPKLILSIDPGYTPRGELLDLCYASGIDTITWNAGHKNNTLMLKRYTKINRDVHPASLSQESWEWLKALPWQPNRGAQLRDEILNSYETGEWYSEVGTQFHARGFTPDDVHRLLHLDPAKKTAVIFPHIFWDGTFFWGTDLFESYETWFVETIKAAVANPRVNWIVKVHPANLVKNARDGLTHEPSEVQALRRHVGELPTHIQMMAPDSPISTASLFGVMDYCVTVRGTVGIEAASFGIPVLTAGTGRYDRLGFTIDSDSKADYLKRLDHIEDILPLSATQRELAERFAYGLFIVRPFTLQTVTLEYQRDRKASLSSRVRAGETGGLCEAPDLRAFSDWVAGGKEDFLSAVE